MLFKRRGKYVNEKDEIYLGVADAKGLLLEKYTQQ